MNILTSPIEGWDNATGMKERVPLLMDPSPRARLQEAPPQSSVLNRSDLQMRVVTGLEDPWLPGVLDIWEKSFPERDRAPLSWWVGLLRDQAKGFAMRRHLLAVARAGEDQPTGMVYYEIRGGSGGFEGVSPVGYMVYLATAPGWRGRGMGTSLYREAIERMFAAGCRAVTFEVEIPEEVGQLSPEDGYLARRRMAWYRRNGARLLEGAIAVAGIGGPQPLPEAILLHPNPNDGPAHTPDGALVCAVVGLGAAAVQRTGVALTLS